MSYILTFIIGAVLGFIAGALFTRNNRRAIEAAEAKARKIGEIVRENRTEISNQDAVEIDRTTEQAKAGEGLCPVLNQGRAGGMCSLSCVYNVFERLQEHSHKCTKPQMWI